MSAKLYCDFKSLAEFFAAWFNQDFDLNGSSIKEIVGKFKESSSDGEVKEVQSDILKFLNENQAEVGEQLNQMFKLEVDPLGFSASPEQFLLEINEALSGH